MSKFIISREAALAQYQRALDTSESVSYSFKTNKDVGYILRDQTDSMFSIHAAHSIDLLDCPDRIWFFAQGWDKEELSSILKKGVTKFVVDNQNDLDLLLDTIKDTEIDLLLRMRLKEHTIHTGKHFVFGFFSDQVKTLLPELKKKQNINKLGIHFHRKTQNVSEWSLKYELSTLFNDDHLAMIDIINIGGGIPSVYKNFRTEVIDSIFEKIKDLHGWLKEKDIQMIIEPGRFIAAPAVRLETEIVNVYGNNIIVDASIFQGAMDTFIAHIRLLVEGEKEDGQAYTIKGKTPDSMDIFRYKVFLENPKKGQKIIFLNAGAYTFSTDFCGLQPIRKEIVDRF